MSEQIVTTTTQISNGTSFNKINKTTDRPSSKTSQQSARQRRTHLFRCSEATTRSQYYKRAHRIAFISSVSELNTIFNVRLRGITPLASSSNSTRYLPRKIMHVCMCVTIMCNIHLVLTCLYLVLYKKVPHGALAVTDRKKMHASTGCIEMAGSLSILFIELNYYLAKNLLPFL